MSVIRPNYPQIGGLTSLTAVGARGNGITDDTRHIQNALDAGLELYVPPDFTFLHTGLTMSVDGGRIEGPGTLKLADGSNCDAITVPATTLVVTLKDFTLDSNQANQAGGPFYGIRLAAIANIANGYLIFDVEHRNFTPTFDVSVGTHRATRVSFDANLSGAVLTTTDQTVAGSKTWTFSQVFQKNVQWGGPHPTIDVAQFGAKGDGSTNDRGPIQDALDLADTAYNKFPGREGAGAGSVPIVLDLGVGQFKIGAADDINGLRWGGPESSHAIIVRGKGRQGTTIFAAPENYSTLIEAPGFTVGGGLEHLTLAGPNFPDVGGFAFPAFPGANDRVLNGYRFLTSGGLDAASALVNGSIVNQLRFTVAHDYHLGDIIEVGAQVFMVAGDLTSATTVDIYPRRVLPEGAGTSAAVHYTSGDLLHGSISFWNISDVDFRDCLRHGISNTTVAYVPRILNSTFTACAGCGIFAPAIDDGSISDIWFAHNKYDDMYINGYKMRLNGLQFEDSHQGYNLEMTGGGNDITNCSFEAGIQGAIWIRDAHDIFLDNAHFYHTNWSSNPEWTPNGTYQNGQVVRWRGSSYTAKNIVGNRAKLPSNTTYWTIVAANAIAFQDLSVHTPAVQLTTSECIHIGKVSPFFEDKPPSYVIQVDADCENIAIDDNPVQVTMDTHTQWLNGWVNDLTNHRVLLGNTMAEITANRQPAQPFYTEDITPLGTGKTADEVAARLDIITTALNNSKYLLQAPGMDPLLVSGVKAVYETRDRTSLLDADGTPIIGSESESVAQWSDRQSGGGSHFVIDGGPMQYHVGPIQPGTLLAPGQGSAPYVDARGTPMSVVFGSGQTVGTTYTIICASYWMADGDNTGDHRLFEMLGSGALVEVIQTRYGSINVYTGSDHVATGWQLVLGMPFVLSIVVNGSTHTVPTVRLNGTALSASVTGVGANAPTGIKIGTSTAPDHTFKQRFSGLVVANGALDFSAGGEGHKIEQWLAFYAGLKVA